MSARSLSVVCAAVVFSFALFAVSTASARPESAGITGTWHCCGAGGAAAQNFFLSTGKTPLHGIAKLPSGKAFAKITGTVSGRKVKIVTTYYKSFAPGYVATFVGTLAANGKTMSGTWKSTANQAGTWTATRS
jgi:hypothetical protein